MQSESGSSLRPPQTSPICCREATLSACFEGVLRFTGTYRIGIIKQNRGGATMAEEWNDLNPAPVEEAENALKNNDDETGKILSFDMTIHGIADTPDAYKIGDKCREIYINTNIFCQTFCI